MGREKLIPKLDALRRKRNTGAYDDYGLVVQGEADLGGQSRSASSQRGRGLDPQEPADKDCMNTVRLQGASRLLAGGWRRVRRVAPTLCRSTFAVLNMVNVEFL